MAQRRENHPYLEVIYPVCEGYNQALVYKIYWFMEKSQDFDESVVKNIAKYRKGFKRR